MRMAATAQCAANCASKTSREKPIPPRFAGSNPEFKILTQSRNVRQILSSFVRATGLPVVLIPPCAEEGVMICSSQGGDLCSLIAGTSQGHEHCRRFVRRLQCRLGRKRRPCKTRCFAGLMEAAVPLSIAGQTVAVALCGQVFTRKPTSREFTRLRRRLARLGIRLGAKAARRAVARTRVASKSRVDAAVEVLQGLEKYLIQAADGALLAVRHGEPRPVTGAKAFVQAHLVQTFKTRDAANAVHLSLSHFCRLFKSATGLTFTEYVARCRVTRAKEMLEDTSQRISEIGFGSGFQSLPHFDRIFKRYVGRNPRQYRQAVRG